MPDADASTPDAHAGDLLVAEDLLVADADELNALITDDQGVDEPASMSLSRSLKVRLVPES